MASGTSVLSPQFIDELRTTLRAPRPLDRLGTLAIAAFFSRQRIRPTPRYIADRAALHGPAKEGRKVTVDLKGKWALVTGASRGIGKQVSRGLAEKGCNLVLHSRSPEHTEKLVGEFSKMGITAVSVGGELSDENSVNALMDEAIAASKGLDVVYNNAAIMTPFRGDYLTTPAEDFRKSFEVNVIAPIRITYRALPYMRARGWGRIVQVTSGIQDQPELMAYAASKAALDKFVRDTVPSLRGSGVLMNLLDPGWLRTDLGGPNAPNAVESVMPGALVPVLVDGEVHGVFFRAQDYAKLS